MQRGPTLGMVTAGAFAALLPLIAAPAASAGEVVDRIVAVVNQDIVLMSEVDELMDYVEASELRGVAGEERAAATSGSGSTSSTA